MKKTLLSMIFCTQVLLPGALPVESAETPRTENCYDPSTGFLSRTYPGRCTATTITDDEAAQVRRRRMDQVRQAVQAVPPPVPPTLKMKSIGTGFFVAPNGMLLTNNHVVADCAALTAETANGRIVPAREAEHDEGADLALLTVDLTVPVAATFSRKAVLDGDRVVAIGFPYHGMAPVKPMAVEGKLAGTASGDGKQLVLRADIRPGNSGGPLFDGSGLVVGVVFAKIDTVRTYQATGSVVRDLGFAIPNDTVSRFLTRRHIAEVTAPPGLGLTAGQVLARSAPFIVRIGCWK